MVGNAYLTADKTTSLTYAANALNVTVDTDDQIDIAIAKVAAAFLTNRRIHEASRTNPQILTNLVNIEKLISEEVYVLQLDSDSSTRYDIIKYKQPADSKHWSMG